MSDTDHLKQRINELESTLTYLQGDFDSLNETVLQHNRQIDKLTAVIEQLTVRLESTSEGSQSSEADLEKPPHY